eukprot:TRINITY_DN17962_c0_g1_i1.p1 TRINITY_DN17962_c0_g1~~TRINITY_DN17962_c0_g1_i1.p1  ORF type:complete len:404 (-),score=106.98 TRINITY_DN17962_c0_g1_i1:165-1355(-)
MALWQLLLLLLCGAVARGSMDLYLLDEYPQARCLDGTPGGYYYSAGAEADSWSFWLEGGGWCYSSEDCGGRAATDHGSSSTWAAAMPYLPATMSENATENPLFYAWNHVQVMYCDGLSFAGDTDAGGLQYRGAKILEAAFQDLLTKRGLDRARNVLLSGGSAGGLSALLHADRVRGWLPEGVNFKSAPFSGVFALAENADGVPVYPDQMRAGVALQNATYALPSACTKRLSAEDRWRCIFAAEVYSDVQSPTFLVNSAYDQWNTGCIFAAEPVAVGSDQNGNCSAIPAWTPCTGWDDCTPAQAAALTTRWAAPVLKSLSSQEAWTRPGNGAFFTSCFTHCGEINGGWMGTRVSGVSTMEALNAWWLADGDNAAAHTYVDCFYTTNTLCNPTCEGQF